MIATYLVEVIFVGLERVFEPNDWHQAAVLGLLLLMFGKFIDISVSIAKLEREHSPWKHEQELMEKEPAFAQWVRSVIANYESALAFTNATFRDHLKEDMDDFGTRLARYAHGYIENSQERPPTFFYRHPDFFAKDVRRQMLATCIVERGEFWQAGMSRALLEREGQLAKAGVKVLRIFIERKERLRDLQDAIEMHRRYGVPLQIAVVDEDRTPVPSRLRKDFMVVDDILLIRQELEDGKLTTTKVWMGQDRDGRREIEKAIADFEDLLKGYALSPEEAFSRAGIALQKATHKP
jgi:hypothetical protein